MLILLCIMFISRKCARGISIIYVLMREESSLHLPLCILTGAMTATFLLSFAISDYFVSNVYPNSIHLAWLSIAFISLSTLSANWGIQTIPNLMASELYSFEVRPIMKSFSRGVQSLLLFIFLMVSKMFVRPTPRRYQP